MQMGDAFDDLQIEEKDGSISDDDFDLLGAMGISIKPHVVAQAEADSDPQADAHADFDTSRLLQLMIQEQRDKSYEQQVGVGTGARLGLAVANCRVCSDCLASDTRASSTPKFDTIQRHHSPRRQLRDMPL
jgi:hypothetical protein